MRTPWGNSQDRKSYGRGFNWVSTASHGGFMLTVPAAYSSLTLAAISRGERWGKYICFEEDCDASMVIFECVKTQGDFAPDSKAFDQLRKSLSYWRPDYLIERGLTPDPEAYAKYLEGKEADRIRDEHGPIVVAAWGDWAKAPMFPVDVPPGKVGVVLANEKYFLLDSEDYKQNIVVKTIDKYPSAVAVER